MNKKILIGSITAVIILIGISFTSVVGFQNTKSTTITETSPLFKVRTSRAIGKESKILTSNYVGRGNTLPFPERDDRIVLVKKVIESIRKMDEKTFERFISFFINYMQKNQKFNGISPDEIGEALYELRNSDEPIPILDAWLENKKHMGNIMFTVHTGCWTDCCTFGYGLDGIRDCIIWLPYFIYLFIYGIAATIRVILISIFVPDSSVCDF